MTINYYYYTFGFLIKKEAYLKYYGFVKENIPKEYCPVEPQENDHDDWKEDALYEWILETHDNGYATTRKIEVDGVEYIVRGFTHDTDMDEYVVVGIDLGAMDRWEGTKVDGTNCFPKDRIKTLVKNPDWIKMIQECDKHCTFYNKVDYGVPDPKYPKFSICPSVRVSTDDCDCCS